MYQTATEKNVGEKVFPYFENQSMTMSEQELAERITKMTKPMTGEEDARMLIICLDFQRWCLRMSDEANTPLHRELDNLFGFTNVYTYSHLLPIESQLILQDRFNPPEADQHSLPKESPRSTRLGIHWMEGMRQKCWALFCIIVLFMVAITMGTTVTVLAQGDNTIIGLPVPDRRRLEELGFDLAEYADVFIEKLSNLSEALGMCLKKEETWTSTVLFEYAKALHLFGVPVSCGMKKASKIANESNTGVSTISNRLYSLFSGGVSVAAANPDPGPAYLLSIVEASIVFDSRFDISLSEVVALCLTNRTVGGFPCMNLCSYYMRGNLDPLTTCLSVVTYAIESNSLAGKALSKLLDFSPKDNKNYFMLICDSTSLNIRRPQTGENQVRSLIEKSLPKKVRNELVETFFTEKSTIERDKLVKDLVSMVPFNPKLANKLYTLSSVSQIERIKGRFTSTRSVIRFCMESRDDLVGHTSVNLSLKFSTYTI